MISDYLSHKKDKEDVSKYDENKKESSESNDMLEKISEQLNNLETAPIRDANTPPPSPADYKFANETNILNGEITEKLQGKYLMCFTAVQHYPKEQ